MTDDRHLDLLALDAQRAGEPLSAGQRAHLAWCATCRAALADLEAMVRALAPPAPPADVPPDREAVILAIARRRAAVARGTSPGRRGWALAGRWAAAAMLILAVGALVLHERRALESSQLASAPAPRPTLPLAQADLNGDGRVDVIDALVLARAVTRGTPRIGDADRHDVDVILAMAVALDGAGDEP